MSDAPGKSGAAGTSALVLGGGGATGVAWEIGLVAGLAEAGIDLTDADLVIGTSAGSVVGAQLATGRPIADLYRAQFDGPTGGPPPKIGARFVATLLFGILTTRDSVRYLRRFGKMALSAKTMTEAERRPAIAALVRADEWPARRLLVTAVDAHSGEFVVFDREAGVGLIDAVGASCAVPSVWPPVTIGARRFMDGGIRSSANADLAAGAKHVIVIAPVSAGGGPIPKLTEQVGALRRAGARALVIKPDAEAKAAIGKNVLDPARRAPAAEAGHAQAARVADSVRAVWLS